MQNNDKRLLYNLIIIGIGTIFTRLIYLVMTPFYSSWLTTSEYGKYDLIATYISLCVPFVTLQLDQAIYRFSIEHKQYSNYYYRMIIKAIIPLMAFMSMVVYMVMIHFDMTTNLILYFIGYFIAMAFYNVNAEYLRGNGKLREYSTLNITTGVLSVLLSITAVRILHLGVAGLLLAFACSYGITWLIAQIAFKPFTVIQTDETSIKELLKYSIPLIPNNISWWITNVSDRTIINIIQGNYYNGIYAICCKIPTMLSIIFGIFNLSFQQVALQDVQPEEQKSYFNKLIKRVIKILFTGSVCIVGLTPLMYHLFLKEEYWEGIICVPILLCGAVFLSIAQYMGDILLVKKNTKAIGGSTICAALVNIVLNLLMIPKWGIMGASLATMISYVVMFLLRSRATRELFIGKELISCIIEYLGLYTVLSVLILMVMDSILWSILMLLLTFFLFILANREIVMTFLKKIIKKKTI